MAVMVPAIESEAIAATKLQLPPGTEICWQMVSPQLLLAV